MERPTLEHDIAAARALARRLGLGAVAPEVLKLAHHTTLRLAPLPIVARVLSAGSFERAWPIMRKEIDVARHLAGAGAPVIAPAPEAGPHEVETCLISLWSFVDHRAAAGDDDARAAARALREIHLALRSYPAPLAPFTGNIDHCGALLAGDAALAALAPADRDFLRARYDDLRTQLAAMNFTSVPLHGDTHIGNVMITPNGAVWADLETVCTGPIEWDLVQLAPSTRDVFGPTDPDLMALLSQLRSVTVAVWCWADSGRSAEVRAAAEYHLALLKRRASI